MPLFTVDPDKCNRDGICVAECPSRVILTESPKDVPMPAPDAEEHCLRCGHCVSVCPEGALSLSWLKPDGCSSLDPEMHLTGDQAEQFLNSRRSIRTFRKKPVEHDKLEKLLKIACGAPSAKNAQPWHWLVVEDTAEVRRFAGIVMDWVRMIIQEKPEVAEQMKLTRVLEAWKNGDERICRGAPHVIVVHGDKNWPFGSEDGALALSHLDLYAPTMGLGTCWGGYLYTAANNYPPLFEAMGLPSDHRAYGAMMVGYPKFKYPRIPRRNPPRVVWA